MFHLRWYIEYSERVSGWLFRKIHQFFSGETGEIPMIDSHDQYTQDQDLNKDHFEWNLNQDFTDIYQNDLGIIYVKFTPGFARSFIAKFRRLIMIYLYLDESVDDDVRVPVSGAKEIPIQPGHILFFNKCRTFGGKCCKWYVVFGKYVSTIINKAKHSSFSLPWRMKWPGIESISRAFKQFGYTCIRGPGRLKLISCIRFHKRI